MTVQDERGFRVDLSVRDGRSVVIDLGGTLCEFAMNDQQGLSSSLRFRIGEILSGPPELREVVPTFAPALNTLRGRAGRGVQIIEGGAQFEES